jgi:hypothetical protein
MPINKNRSRTKTTHISRDILSSQVSLHDQLLIQYKDCNDMDASQMASILLVQELLFRYNTGGALFECERELISKICNKIGKYQ